MKRQQGFTLVEIMIVVAIVALMATMAMPAFVRARESSAASICINNLRLIDHAKLQVAFKYNYERGQTLSDESQLDEFIQGHFADLKEPFGESYEVNPIGTAPSCTYGDTHTL